MRNPSILSITILHFKLNFVVLLKAKLGTYQALLCACNVLLVAIPTCRVWRQIGKNLLYSWLSILVMRIIFSLHELESNVNALRRV